MSVTCLIVVATWLCCNIVDDGWPCHVTPVIILYELTHQSLVLYSAEDTGEWRLHIVLSGPLLNFHKFSSKIALSRFLSLDMKKLIWEASEAFIEAWRRWIWTGRTWLVSYSATSIACFNDIEQSNYDVFSSLRSSYFYTQLRYKLKNAVCKFCRKA